ncbi:MAG: hypothetical protein ACFFG0_02185 [Candidatus Thorarchaeota archaeon]
MILGVIDKQVEEHFTVSDSQGNLISGIDSTSFSTYVYNPDGIEVSNSVNESVVELGGGNYKYLFTPNQTGTWYVLLVHSLYFPWGKADDIQVYQGDLTDIHNNVVKTLGLTHHNFYIDQTSYDEHGNMISARVRIYSDSASVGSNSNVIETYLITADGTECGQFNYWTQVVL